jgi:hypothetical protein
MMKKKFGLGILTVVVAMGLAAVAFANPMGHHGQHNQEGEHVESHWGHGNLYR